MIVTIEIITIINNNKITNKTNKTNTKGIKKIIANLKMYKKKNNIF